MITEIPVSFTMYVPVPSAEFMLCWMILGMINTFIWSFILAIVHQKTGSVSLGKGFKDTILDYCTLIVCTLGWPYITYILLIAHYSKT